MGGGGWRLTPKERLGKAIFFDRRLSVKTNQSCAACHSVETGFTGPEDNINEHGSVYEGSVAGRFGNRKPPTAAYATPSPILHFITEDNEALFIGGNFWDGNATGEKLGNPAADQALGPFLNPAEQALRDSACVVYQVCRTHGAAFSSVWGARSCWIAWPAGMDRMCRAEGGPIALPKVERTKVDAAYGKIGLSVAAYEASSEVNQFTSKFDYYLKGIVKLTKEEREGLNLFQGKGKCTNCHVIGEGRDAKGSLLTDFTYDNLGVPKNPENPVYLKDPEFVDQGLGGFLSTREDYQAFAAENRGKQKVPTLRNVDKRPYPGFVKAYMHNGYFKTLEGLVHFYNTRDVKPVCPGPYTEAQALVGGCWPPPEVKENMNDTELGNLQLTPDEEAAIVAFLKTLSDGYVPWRR
jgi:cytochrome c peroxidase